MYLQSMFWTKNKKTRYTPAVLYIKVGFKWVNITRACFRDVERKMSCIHSTTLGGIIRMLLMLNLNRQFSLPLSRAWIRRRQNVSCDFQ